MPAPAADPQATAFSWYINRLTRMSPAEVGGRALDHVSKQVWRRRWVRPGPIVPLAPDAIVPKGGGSFSAVLPAGTIGRLSEGSKREIISSADQIMAGHLEILGVLRTDLVAPDWFFDPVTCRRAPATEYCFSIDHRSEEATGNVKQIWELSRHQYGIVLAAAYAVTEDESYAHRVASHLRYWWQSNPFLSGIHWTSGIEIGLRLISWVWIRRLLDGWAAAPALFEGYPLARRQIWWHQCYLSRFRSRGSSANNHAVAETAGQLVAALAFPWFPESARWARESRCALQASLRDNTFTSGLNREMAFEYHGFVAELGLVAAAEASLARDPLGTATTDLLCKMLDAGAATLDATRRGPRYGDGDGGRVLPVGNPGRPQWETLLAIDREVFGPMDWWPEAVEDTAAVLLSAMLGRDAERGSRRRPAISAISGTRPTSRPWHMSDAGVTILRTADDHPEIWCRCDAGPHGFLSIAAHGHADALSVEVRHDGTDVLADPGTYCYHGEPSWRRYFRSTLAHNTVEVGGRDQSFQTGPFMWSQHAESTLKRVASLPDGDFVWDAEHDGYEKPPLGVRHARSVTLFARRRRIEILDRLEGSVGYNFRLAFHFGPDVDAQMDGNRVALVWTGRTGAPAGATMQVPPCLSWNLLVGSETPISGWYAPSFGHKVKAATLIGEGRTSSVTRMLTCLQFSD